MFVGLLATTVWPLDQRVRQETMDIPLAEPITIARIYSDADGGSHFAQTTITFTLVDFAPPAPPISVSAIMEAENVSIISSPPGWFGDWHPVPRRQFIIVLSGELEVEVSDGEKRLFGPGAICLVEDTTGEGHVSRVTSKVRCYVAVVPLGND
jgi:hypothetical protein